MKHFEGISEAADAVRLHILTKADGMPDAMAARLKPLARTGADVLAMVTSFAESVYANRGRQGVTKEAKQIAAGVALLCDQWGYYGQLYGRAQGIAAGLARDTGEPGEWPDKAADPAPADGFDITTIPAPVELVPAPTGGSGE